MYSFKNNSTIFNKSLILEIENYFYMFGIPEGIQKLFNEKKNSLKTISCFIISNKDELISLIGICHTLSEINIEIRILHNFLKLEDIELLKSTILPGKIQLNNKINDEFCIITPLINGFLIEFKKIREEFKINKLLKLSPKFPKEKISELIKCKNILYNNILYKWEEFITYQIIKPVFIVTNSIPSNEKELNLLNEILKKCEIIFYLKNIFIKNILTKIILIPFQNYISPSVLKFRDILNKFDSRMLKPQNNSTNKEISNFSLLNNSIEYNKLTKKYISNINNYFLNDFILFLGTGSAIPTKYRNVSSCLININKKVILLDCGEGTINQIDNAFGNLNILKELSLIIISHAHADHFLGMFSIINYVYNSFNKKLNIIAPNNLKKYINFFNYNNKINFIESNSLNKNIDNIIIKSCEVQHRIYSNAFVLDINGFRLSYSGDCRPSLEFAKLAYNSDIMIHEATFNDDMEIDAKRTGHSTFSEAINIFKESNSKKLFLTHFSQRYNLTVDFKLNDINIMIAYDLLLYNFKTINSKLMQQYIIKNFPK